MKSRKNLTRFTYDTTDFKGWRLCICRKGTTFTKYYSDKQYGGPRKALNCASIDLDDIKEILSSSRLVNGKLSQTTIKKVENILA
jgi:hypothetical protein